MGRLDQATVVPGTRISDEAWVVVVLWFAALNLLDLGLTLHLVDQGAAELNPIMAALLDAGWEWAALFKALATAAVAAGLWFGRRHLLVRRIGIAIVVLFVILIAYQIVDVWATA
jgi:hypothetical protein